MPQRVAGATADRAAAHHARDIAALGRADSFIGFDISHLASS